MSVPAIAVTGATGALGGAVARHLADRGVEQRLVVRDPERAPALPGAQVARITGYGDAGSVSTALHGVRRLLFVSGEEAEDRLEQHRTLVAAAVEAGVEHLVYTSFLAASPDATFVLARHHFHTEQAIVTAGAGLTSLRNSLYQDVMPYFAGDGVIHGPAGDGRFAPVARRDIAEVAAACLADPVHDGRTYDLTGPERLSMGDVAATLSRVLGNEVRYDAETLDQAYASRAVYGAPDWEVEGWVTSYAAIAAGELDVVSDDVRRVTGHEATRLEDLLTAG